jgi:hypothetical protein
MAKDADAHGSALRADEDHGEVAYPLRSAARVWANCLMKRLLGRQEHLQGSALKSEAVRALPLPASDRPDASDGEKAAFRGKKGVGILLCSSWSNRVLKSLFRFQPEVAKAWRRTISRKTLSIQVPGRTGIPPRGWQALPKRCHPPPASCDHLGFSSRSLLTASTILWISSSRSQGFIR